MLPLLSLLLSAGVRRTHGFQLPRPFPLSHARVLERPKILGVARDALHYATEHLSAEPSPEAFWLPNLLVPSGFGRAMTASSQSAGASRATAQN